MLRVALYRSPYQIILVYLRYQQNGYVDFGEFFSSFFYLFSFCWKTQQVVVLNGFDFHQWLLQMIKIT